MSDQVRSTAFCTVVLLVQQCSPGPQKHTFHEMVMWANIVLSRLISLLYMIPYIIYSLRNTAFKESTGVDVSLACCMTVEV